jgi:CRP/FNR family transcriptional regulator, cyclic AMP receptor protein
LPWGLVVIALSISNRPRPPLQLDLSHLALQGGLQMRQFSAGECVIRQGSEAEHFYVITSGRARVLIDDDYGAQTEVAELVAGHFFGEVGLLDNGPRTATVEAVDDLEVLVMNKDSFLHLVEHANVSSDYIRSARDKYRFSTPS